MNIISKLLGVDKLEQTLAKHIQLANINKDAKANKRTLNWSPKSIYRTRQDVQNWNIAQDMANNTEEPRNYLLQLLLAEIRLDALLTSQIENRKQQIFTAPFSLKNSNNEVNEAETLLLQNSQHYKLITDAILEKRYHGYNMVELDVLPNKTINVTLILRTNYTPINGLFFADYADVTKKIAYRNLPEYGRFILEFLGDGFGLLNKAVPHVLFKRFAQSCWSELCEIYGIPPRVLKTNTQDPTMLQRADSMMRDMGAAAWFIIDDTESFEFAQASGTLTGDVYKNLIALCNNENSLLISGAVIGQDTAHGNRSKEDSSQNMLYQLVQADMQMVQADWNNIVIPALVQLGAMPAGLTLAYNAEEDIKQLFEFTKGLLQYKDVDNEWIEQKFGVPVINKEVTTNPPNNNDDDVQKAIEKKLSAFFD